MRNEKCFTILGWISTATAIAMYVSYISQINNNLHGVNGDWLQPLVAEINCSLWLGYDFLKKPKKDWPISIANSLGILFGLIAFSTAD